MEDEENFGAAEGASLDLWDVSGSGSFASRLICILGGGERIHNLLSWVCTWELVSLLERQ